MDQRTLVRTLSPAVVLLLLAGCTDDGPGVHGKPGAAGVRDPYFKKLGNGGYDVQHYALTLDYEPKTGRLKGTAEITARATQDLSAFNLDLHGMTVDGATVDGKKAAANRAGDELTLRPHSDIGKGTTFRTVVRYSGDPEMITDGDKSEEGWLRTADGALAVGQPAGSMAWFPGSNHPSDKATYDITVTVPKGLKAISNGELKSERTTGGRTTFAWKSKEPMASYLATLAIGDFRLTPSRTPSGVPVLTAVDPAGAEESAEGLAEIPEIMEWATENFGTYPLSSTGAIVVPTKEVGYALETQTKPVFPRDQLDVTTLVHEIAHQWYGNSVSPKSWKDMWLNEGFAQYAEWIWAEDYDDKRAQESFDEAFADDANWEFAPADPPTAADISGDPVYYRGAMVLHKVRQAVGEDTFYEILHGWAQTYRHANASTADFTAYVEKKSGKDLDELWETWLYGKDKPATP
ncbi:M1 family metallopeptidase [Streptomyces lunaelactis]|uniref:M1 family metallopeptidase n=1 Tax=Streptomyces lunaelactis TaxID=1535768 RepID=UPI0015845941|nr:M1 family metallopeptidase [Streptomyces lunaelactis]NUK08308.1 M1 family metallopeptidase [Streptomyces lunaelactis]